MNILNPKFIWTPPSATDVQATWRRFGWKPLAEQPAREKERQERVRQLTIVKKENAA